MNNLPYTPTRVLPTATEDDLVYVLQPPNPSSPSSQLLAVNASTTFNSTSLPFTTVSSSLPFVDDIHTKAYTVAIDRTGELYAYAGDCDGGAAASSLWKFTPSDNVPIIEGTWSKMEVSPTRGTELPSLSGANYLAGGIAFASSNLSAGIYVFGGMCPNETPAQADDWTKDANYSNSVLTLEPAAALASYNLGLSTSKGPPIAEAGFSITPLEPSLLQSKNGNQSQQNFVLLGGHTQQAFINMSEVALLSLPEQSWTFLPVDTPGEAQKTDLAVREALEVEPRSGHTAVLTPDGRRVVMYGGWVGDINTPANPQLAVLELGDGYGGDGDWRWTIPDQVGTGPESGTGLYGHGAVMLPGDVMMMVGGYEMRPSAKTREKRALVSHNPHNYFFNTSSNSWVSSYTHPKVSPSRSASATSGSQGITASKRAGLGAGLVFGIIALLVIVVFYFWYARRLKRRREAHEEDLRNLGPVGQPVHWLATDGNVGNSEMTVRASRDAYPWNTGSGETSREQVGNHTPRAERTGLLFEIPSPTRGLRRSLHSRGAYQPAPRYDDGRLSRGSGNIHPIDERDEYEDEAPDQPSSTEPKMTRPEGYHILDSVPVLDPFQDPAEGSRTPSPQSPARERQLEIQSWVNDWAAADARMQHQAGRVSPDRTDRTSSTLSDQSMRSNWSGHSIQRSVGTIGRTLSQRSAVLFSHAHQSSNTTVSPTNERHYAIQTGRDSNPDDRRSQSLTLFPRRATMSDATQVGASSIQQLQQESEALLGGSGETGPSSPSRAQNRARGWMGSMRRAFGRDRPGSTSPDHGESSTSSSPTKLRHETGVPRRAASASAALWQKRQGAKDWDVEGAQGAAGKGVGNGSTGTDEEWDVESAVERRVVQVMFTVPREKLRVVNGGPEGDGESVVSTEVKDAAKEMEGKGKAKEKDEESR